MPRSVVPDAVDSKLFQPYLSIQYGELSNTLFSIHVLQKTKKTTPLRPCILTPTPEVCLRGRLHHLLSVAKSFEIASTLLLSRTPFDLDACYDVGEGAARPHDVMAQPLKLSFSNGSISRMLCRRLVGPTPSDSSPETLRTLILKKFIRLPLQRGSIA